MIVTSLDDRRLTAPNIIAHLNQCHEKMSTSTVRKRLCEYDLYGRIAVKKLLLRKQNNIKTFQWAKAHKDWTIKQWNKVLWIDKSKFKIFGSNRRVYVQWRVAKRAATPSISSTIKHRGSTVMVCVWILLVAMSGICIRWRANWINLAIKASCSMIRSHLECTLWVKDLFSHKIMSQSMQVNSARSYN